MRCFTGLFAASLLVFTAQALVPSPSLENEAAINDRAAAAPPPCTTVERPNPPSGLHCNDAGSVKRESLFDQSRAASQKNCRNLCLDTRPCISFSYNSATKLCKLYDVIVDRQRFTRDSASKTVFWNRNCYKIVCPHCDVGQKLCSPGQCTDVQTDTANCGSCGNNCDTVVPGSVCSGGSCTCPAPTKECSDGCKDTTKDNSNCGQCNNPCDTAGGQSCDSGTCQCPTNQKYCGVNTGCLETNTNENCGQCGVTCSGANEHCDGTACVCDQNFTRCGTECVNTAIDPQNCGVCFSVCAAPATCSNSQCNPGGADG